MNKVTIELKDGTIITGLPENLAKLGLLKDANVSGYYRSETKGLIKISDMNDIHIKNALMKHYREHLDKLNKEDNLELVALGLNTGPDDLETIQLLDELFKRHRLPF